MAKLWPWEARAKVALAYFFGFFGFWAQNFFGGLNQKSAMISMCKIHIYIDSESFRQIR